MGGLNRKVEEIWQANLTLLGVAVILICLISLTASFREFKTKKLEFNESYKSFTIEERESPFTFWANFIVYTLVKLFFMAYGVFMIYSDHFYE